MTHQSVRVFGAAFLITALTLANSAQGLSYPLSSDEIREAYYLGRSTDGTKLAKFFGNYVHKFPYPVKGPYVESVELRTPYEQVVLASRTRLSNYDPVEAVKDFSSRPGIMLVLVNVYSTRDYSGPVTSTTPSGTNLWSAGDYLRDFQFRVEQKNAVKPRTIKQGSACGFGGCSPFPGFQETLQFDADQLQSDETTITITTPDGTELTAEFDLDTLK